MAGNRPVLWPAKRIWHQLRTFEDPFWGHKSQGIYRCKLIDRFPNDMTRNLRLGKNEGRGAEPIGFQYLQSTTSMGIDFDYLNKCPTHHILMIVLVRILHGRKSDPLRIFWELYLFVGIFNSHLHHISHGCLICFEANHSTSNMPIPE